MAETESSDKAAAPVLPDDLLAILACPSCHAPVELVGQRLVCQGCRRRYRIDDGIPIMLIDQAELPD